MIRVNLLPEAAGRAPRATKTRVKRDIPYTWIFIGLVVVLITCVGLGGFHLSLQKKAEAIQSDILRLQNDIKKLKLDVRKVNEVKTKRTELNNKLAIIDKLKSAQKGPVHLLDQLASSIPPRVWLTGFSENGDSMTLDGKALEHVGISRFMQKLDESPAFSSVELSNVNSDARSKAGEDIKSFHLTCRIQIPSDI